MATPAAFSRLQLAAALLEYDNDPDNPEAPYVSAQDSAIFAHLRRNPAARPEVASRRSDYLGVSIPSESGILEGRESVLDTRRSRASKASIDALHNPFGADRDSEYEGLEEEAEQELEVDLASWGLDTFIPKDKKSSKGKAKQPMPAVGSTRARLPSASNATLHDSSLLPARHGLVTSKSISLGGDIEATQALGYGMPERRRSFGSPLDLVGMEPSGVPIHPQSRRRTSQASLPASSALIPFPTGSVRSPSPGADQAYREPSSRLHDRTYSTGSMTSRILLDTRDDAASQHLSIFDDAASKPLEDNPFAIQASSHTSRFDPKAANLRSRAYSNATMSTRMMPENDNASTFTSGDPYTRERRYSTLELLRPKVLVMPSPLQQVSTKAVPKPAVLVPTGFEVSTDGPPLPPGARSTRRLSSSIPLLDSVGPESGLIPSNSFTPNPLMDLTLSQKTFRNTLVVPGQSMAYIDALPRATEEGEQVQLDPDIKEEALQAAVEVDPNFKASRPAGKLYGKSLIDDLENRKAQMRSKQRTFVGDQRPSMMARDSSNRVSTLIDPATLMARPTTQRTSSYETQGATLARHPSVTIKPLLNFDGEKESPLQPPKPPGMGARLPSSRSVFGVDTLWNQEMEKLKAMQAAEEKENEERRIREEEEERKRQAKKDKRKRKGKNKSTEADQLAPPTFDHPASPRVSAEPPMLPDIQRATRRVPPKPSNSDASSESDDDEVRPIATEDKSVAWHSSDDEGDGPRRTTGVGLRYPQKKVTMPSANDDSDEDLPLAATIRKAQARQRTNTRRPLDNSDEDEDKPLSRIIMEAKSTKAFSIHSRNQADDDDEQPLGLRASHMPFKPVNGEDEDDMPLAFHPEQQRRTQYQMMVQQQQQQQQQQQMMMQAQLQSNMLMNASMMGPGYYNPNMMNPMAMMGMQAPMPMPSPPPIHDEAKLVRVDRWRRDVVVEGESF